MVASEFFEVVVEMDIVIIAVVVLVELASVVFEIVLGVVVSNSIVIGVDFSVVEDVVSGTHIINSTLISFLLSVIQVLPSKCIQLLVILSSSPCSFKAAIFAKFDPRFTSSPISHAL